MSIIEASQAISIVEGLEDASPQDQIDAWQSLVDTGLAWQLQGWYGRTAQALINEGIINGGQNA